MIEAFIKSVEIHEAGDLAQVVEHIRFVGNSVSALGDEYRRLPSKPRPYGAALAQAGALAKKHGVTIIDYIALSSSVQFDNEQNKQVPA